VPGRDNEWTNEVLAIDVQDSTRSKRVIEVLSRLIIDAVEQMRRRHYGLR